MDVVAQINHIKMSIEPEVDLGTLQRACPEIGHYLRYIENRIQPSDAKWARIGHFIRIIILSTSDISVLKKNSILILFCVQK